MSKEILVYLKKLEEIDNPTIKQDTADWLGGITYEKEEYRKLMGTLTKVALREDQGEVQNNYIYYPVEFPDIAIHPDEIKLLGEE